MLRFAGQARKGNCRTAQEGSSSQHQTGVSIFFGSFVFYRGLAEFWAYGPASSSVLGIWASVKFRFRHMGLHRGLFWAYVAEITDNLERIVVEYETTVWAYGPQSGSGLGIRASVGSQLRMTVSWCGMQNLCNSVLSALPGPPSCCSVQQGDQTQVKVRNWNKENINIMRFEFSVQ